MKQGFDPGALLARSYPLAGGPRVCLRLARPRDAAGIRGLHERHQLELGELELARLVGGDPRRRLVICAMALIGSAERIIGVGAIDLRSERDRKPGARPATLVVDDSIEGLEPLLCDALMGRAAALSRARAA